MFVNYSYYARMSANERVEDDFRTSVNRKAMRKSFIIGGLAWFYLTSKPAFVHAASPNPPTERIAAGGGQQPLKPAFIPHANRHGQKSVQNGRPINSGPSGPSGPQIPIGNPGGNGGSGSGYNHPEGDFGSEEHS